MIFLIQLFNMIQDKEEFLSVFSMLTEEECHELGYDSMDDFIECELFDRFGLKIDSEFQFNEIKNAMLKPSNMNYLKISAGL
jgi:hypothetical protein